MAGSSLRRRLLGLLLAVTALAWLATGVIGYLDARHEAHELLDGHLAQTASLLIVRAGGDAEEIDTEHTPSLHHYSRKTAFQVWERGSVLRLHSANAPNSPLSEKRDGFSDTTHAGVAWRVFSAWDGEHEVLIQVAERQEARDEIAGALAKSLALSMLGVLPLLALAIWMAVGRGLLPLQALGLELAKRDPERLAPLDFAAIPVEVQPLVTELNRLFARIDDLLARERRFTADAAHELRTPLAALRTQAQVARAARSDAVRQEALDGIIAGSDRAAHLIEQMLTLARLESHQTSANPQPCDLREIARSEIAAIAPRAFEKNIELTFEANAALPVTGHPGLLAILARNLLDNAVRYAQPGGRVLVTVIPSGHHAELTISNTGPGVPGTELPRLGERFHRVEGSGESGSGLGLSIVRRIAELHHGRLRIGHGANGGGLEVNVQFPAAS